MKYLEHTKNNNPVIYNTFKNAHMRNRFSHAYLFAAAPGTTIESEPYCLAQILISKQPFSGSLRSLKSYPDFQIINNETILKKDQVVDAISRLRQTPLERRGKKILLIKNLEKANVQSLNSLLKFLESPPPNSYLLFTTSNLARIPSTIKSRTQIINVKSPTKKATISGFINLGISHANAKLIANFTSNLKLANSWTKGILTDHKKQILNALDSSLLNKEKMYSMFFQIITPATAFLSLNLLNAFFNDIWKLNYGFATAFSTTKVAAKYSDLNFDYKAALVAINDFLKSKDLNTNFDLHKSKFLLVLKGLYG